MEPMITRTVTEFNTALTGKAVYLKGFDINGDEFDRVFLVKRVNGEKLILINSQSDQVEVHSESFATESNPDGLKLTVLEAN